MVSQCLYQTTMKKVETLPNYYFTLTQKDLEILIDDRWQTYSAKHEFPDHAENEIGPEYVQTEEDHQHHIEEVVAEEGGVVVNGVDPGTVDQPVTQTQKSKKSYKS